MACHTHWRNQRTDIDGEVDFHQKDSFDNLDRIVKTERYDTTASGNLNDRARFCDTACSDGRYFD